jgi:hypothetical protein
MVQSARRCGKERIDKKIIFTSGQLRFPETGDASPEHLMVMERILIGQRPDSAHDPSISGLRPDDVPSAPILVNHGQEMIIPVVDRFDRIKRLIEQRQPLSSVTTCVAGINTLYFDDGTSWMAPGLYLSCRPGYTGKVCSHNAS